MMGQRGVILFCLSIIRSVWLGRLANDPMDPFDAHKDRRSWQRALQRNRWSRIVVAFILATHVALATAESTRFESGSALIDYLDQLYQGQSSEAQMLSLIHI